MKVIDWARFCVLKPLCPGVSWSDLNVKTEPDCQESCTCMPSDLVRLQEWAKIACMLPGGRQVASHSQYRYPSYCRMDHPHPDATSSKMSISGPMYPQDIGTVGTDTRAPLRLASSDLDARSRDIGQGISRAFRRTSMSSATSICGTRLLRMIARRRSATEFLSPSAYREQTAPNATPEVVREQTCCRSLLIVADWCLR